MIPYAKLPKLSELEQATLKRIVEEDNMWTTLFHIPSDCYLEGCNCIVVDRNKVAITHFGLEVYKEYFPCQK